MYDALIDDKDNVFYIALSPERIADGFKMAKINETFGSEIRDPSLHEIGTLTLSADGTYATITVTDMDAEGAFHFEATIENADGELDGHWGRGVWIVNDMPKLYYSDLDRDDTAWYVNLDNLSTEWWCTPGNSRVVQFYFGSQSDIQSGSVKPLEMDDLIFPDYLDADDFEDDDRKVPKKTYRVETAGFNEAILTTVSIGIFSFSTRFPIPYNTAFVLPLILPSLSLMNPSVST